MHEAATTKRGSLRLTVCVWRGVPTLLKVHQAPLAPKATDAAPRAVLDAYDRAFNGRSLDNLVQLFTDNAVITSSDGSVLQGKEQIRAGLGPTLTFENLRLVSEAYDVAGDTVTRNIRISWEPASDPTIRNVRQNVTFQAGKIRSLTNTVRTPSRANMQGSHVSTEQLVLAAPCSIGTHQDFVTSSGLDHCAAGAAHACSHGGSSGRGWPRSAAHGGLACGRSSTCAYTHA